MKDELIRKTTGLVADSIEMLSVDYSKLGVCFRKQLRKLLIKKGGPWASVAFAYKDVKSGEEDVKVMLSSFKSSEGEYKRFSYFNIQSKEEARLICRFLKEVFNLEKEDV